MTTAGPVLRCRSCGVFLLAPSPYGAGSTAPPPVVCPRCGRRPDGRRWIAHPPGAPAVPGQTGPPTEPLPRIARDGGRPPTGAPNRIGARVAVDPAARPHPRWGLPTVAWTTPRTSGPDPRNPRPVLTASTVLLAAVAVLAVASAAAETWRFVLLLHGRTAVLSAGTVATSDVLVAVAGLFTPAVTVAALVVTVLALLRTTAWAADRAELAPPRTSAGMLLRLLVPGWNVYGAGQVTVETHALLLAPPAHPDALDPVDRSAAVRRRDHRLIGAWWCAWVVNLGLLVATLARGLGGSLQAIADTVELHIALDLSAAVTAALGAAVLYRFRRLTDVTPAAPSRWTVQRPAPTRGRVTDGRPLADPPSGRTAANRQTTGDQPQDRRTPDSGPDETAASDDDREPADPSATVSA